jgi:hypothetical protein
MRPAISLQPGNGGGGDTSLVSSASMPVSPLGLPLLIVALGAAMLVLGRFADRQYQSSRLATDGQPPMTSPAGRVKPESTVAVVSTWDDIAGLPYDRRVEFLADMRSLLMQLEAQNPDVPRSPPTDELRAARGQLRVAFLGLNAATQATWESCKEQVGAAWQMLEAAYRDVPVGPRA